MRYFVILFSVFWLASCASQHGVQHQTHKEYAFSKNVDKSCFNVCQADKKQCEIESKKSYDSCLKETEGEAKNSYNDEKYQYEKEYTEDGEKIVKKSGNFDFTVTSKNDEYDLDRPSALQESAPNYDDALQAEQDKCIAEHLKYKCQEKYDTCYKKCGGKIIYK